VTIDGSLFHESNVGDAIRLHYFTNATVSKNEFSDVNEDGSHNEVLQTVHGGANLTFVAFHFSGSLAWQSMLLREGVRLAHMSAQSTPLPVCRTVNQSASGAHHRRGGLT
jgi:hypothetical protein